MAKKVSDSLDLPIRQRFFWTDSTIAIAWINYDSHRRKTYVANRVTEILQLSEKEMWGHMQFEHNPADIIPRGMKPQDLKDSLLWWRGPSWLSDDFNTWPKYSTELFMQEVPEARKTTLSAITASHPSWDIVNKFSSFGKLRRIIAYCLRFAYNVLKRGPVRKGPLSVEEIENASQCIIRNIQHDQFSEDISSLLNKKSVGKKSNIKSLNPFIDEFGLMRVGGRLGKANISYSQKHPIILPTRHFLTELIIRHEHYAQLHAGPQTLLASIRLKYWPLHGKSAVRKVLRKCILCFRNRSTYVKYIMGELPIRRLTANRPFLNCGIDYAGPFPIKVSRNRSDKAYLAVFVCFSTKAVHLEIANSLSTESFLKTLKRFIARRGKCQNIYSDNGKNFIGANQELQVLGKLLKSEEYRNVIQRHCSDVGIQWHFIPAYSPHTGGLWEAAVKSAKTHFYKVIGNTLLTYEELCTVFIQIEAVLNSRPLVAVSDDPCDLSAITPGHFLIGQPLTEIPELDYHDVPESRVTRFQLVAKMKAHFWTRWSREYLTQLQGRGKWARNQKPQINVRDLVLLQDDHLPPMQWR